MMQTILEDTRNELPNMQIEAVLVALAARPVTADELAGFVDAMRAAAVTLPFTDEERATLVDTCGTGGDASGTFNISTAVALVAAAAGAKIAKHGNRSLTSRCGSADVLDALGVPTSLTAETGGGVPARHRIRVSVRAADASGHAAGAADPAVDGQAHGIQYSGAADESGTGARADPGSLCSRSGSADGGGDGEAGRATRFCCAWVGRPG